MGSDLCPVDVKVLWFCEDCGEDVDEPRIQQLLGYVGRLLRGQRVASKPPGLRFIQHLRRGSPLGLSDYPRWAPPWECWWLIIGGIILLQDWFFLHLESLLSRSVYFRWTLNWSLLLCLVHVLSALGTAQPYFSMERMRFAQMTLTAELLSVLLRVTLGRSQRRKLVRGSRSSTWHWKNARWRWNQSWAGLGCASGLPSQWMWDY